MVGVGFNGLLLVRLIARGGPAWRPYGLLVDGPWPVLRHLVLPEAFAFLIAGCWLTWRTMNPDSMVSRRILQVQPRTHGAGHHVRPRWGLLLLPLVGMLVEMLGLTFWF